MDLHIHKLLADGGKVAIELPVGEPDLLSLLVVQHGECVLHRVVESKSLKVGKSLKIGKNRIKSEKSEFIFY